MTDPDFDEIAADLASPSSAWLGAVQEARAELLREHPEGVGHIQIGHRAWQKITPIQRAHALDPLFHAYVLRVYDEERAAQLGAAVDEGRSYIEPDDEHLLAESLLDVDFSDPDAQVDGVLASALSNVLSELDLVRHRLAMATKGPR
ncbi:hypothetical protein ACFZAM_02865 [Streptomyces sp. NPDC008079]|uniref:hypothetical protein n=1 Tax=Streptomyces sp. NPDC008079 TaxID=3364806 RepID=UPI0036EFEBA7